MFKSAALLSLVQSMSKPEKKAFNIAFSKSGPMPHYLSLYNLASKDKAMTPDTLRDKFLKQHKGASFDTTVKYLYKILLDTMLELRSEQDSYYSLFDKILKARILFEKSLFDECFDLLQNVISRARKLENYYALLIASRLELEYLLSLNFPGIDEKTLLHKQFRINEAMRITQKINQQSALYELLKHRVLHKGNTRSEQQKNELNDLVVSEMSLVASSNVDNFEIQKLHQLFQANYLISVGDYKSALHSFYELNTLLENNKQLWSNPPIYYLLTLEGILDSLRSLRNYEGMIHFIDQLRKLNNPSLNFNANVTCLIFLYEVFPLLDKGDFSASENLMRSYNEELFKKTHLLSLARNAELSLYTALIFFGIRDYGKAQKALSKIIFIGKSYTSLPIYRTIRLVNLMILYERKDFDLIKYETRSIKRDMHVVGKEYKIERSVLSFVNKQNLPASGMKRKALWEKISEDHEKIRHDVFEQQILRLFDFSAWMESKIRKVSLSEILIAKF
jgi:tetratricopeptide (TPR) repeat protein